ncbi:histidine phosphatase family protein [uncultured Enterovirga sp.]|uniref:SixA phosphatase family protein n=1 Tax=uncultured Enterovirga sp. TaxID=2026352 RepID=UPI0035CB56AC
MKRLFLLRHAKAVEKTATDVERVLAGRGRKDMAKVSRYLVEEGLTPDLALVSPAARTRETWSLAGLPDVPVRFDERIYEAEVADLLEVIASVDDAAGSVILVGHNPGIEDLARAVAADPEPVRSGLPTAALVVIELPAETWRDGLVGTGRIERYLTPAKLEAGTDA